MATENKNIDPVVENNASVENVTPQTEVKVSVEVEATNVENNAEVKAEEPKKTEEKKPTAEKKVNKKTAEPTAKTAKEKKTATPAEKTDKKAKKPTASKEKKTSAEPKKKTTERTIPEPPVLEDGTAKAESKKKANKKQPAEAETKGKKSSKKATAPTAEKPAEPKAKTPVKEVDETPKKKSLADMIKEAASSKYPYRAANGMTILDAKTRKKLSDEEFENVSRHRTICQELVRLSSENNDFPFTALVYFAVGSDAHKKNVFEKGYKTINVPKAETILRWLDRFAKHNKNPKFYTCEKIVHAFAKYYDTQSKKDKDFNSVMKQFTKQPADEGFKASQYKTMEQFYSVFTKPIIVKTEVKEDGTEKVVSAKPNPLADKKRNKEKKTTAVAS